MIAPSSLQSIAPWLFPKRLGDAPPFDQPILPCTPKIARWILAKPYSPGGFGRYHPFFILIYWAPKSQWKIPLLKVLQSDS
jgi:hypothetical protein